MSDISQKVLRTIKAKKITPKSKWHFLLKNYVFWVLLSITIFISALAITTILFMLSDNDWDIFTYLDKSFLEYVLISIPYFWLLVLALFSGVTYFIFKHTRRGYHHRTYKVVIGSLLLSLGLGGILFECGLDSEIHETLSKQIPFYNNLVYTKENIWIFPDKGLLSGEVVDVKNKENFTLQDFNGKVWQIQGNDIDWPDNFILLKGTRIKLIGERKGEHLFSVKIVKFWDWKK